MSAASLRQAIAERAAAILPVALMRQARHWHNRNWRECSCTYCETKRETVRVVSIPALGNYQARANRREMMAGRAREDLDREVYG